MSRVFNHSRKGLFPCGVKYSRMANFMLRLIIIYDMFGIVERRARNPPDCSARGGSHSRLRRHCRSRKRHCRHRLRSRRESASANRLGQAALPARRRGDCEQEAVELNSKCLCGMNKKTRKSRSKSLTPRGFLPPNSSRSSGYSNLWAERMNGKFDFARALVVVAFLPGDLDRGKPGLSSVDEIYTHRG